jgi:tol-pal system-associated acyl-CoA thioesterase|tara:strand:- start:4137 stop:4565 length:429 start_codon:yes stop_codon:yes gene_type:complete
MNKTIKHKDFFLKIYIEDTDFQGFVYHANYIKFFERARSDFLSNNNISQEQHRNDGFVFVVKKIEIDYLTTSKLGDTLIVQSSVYKKSNARMIFNQKIINQIDNKIICEGDVEICFINIYTKKPKPFPDDLLLIFDKGEIDE